MSVSLVMWPHRKDNNLATILQVKCGHSQGCKSEGVSAQLKAVMACSCPSLASPTDLIPLTPHSDVCTGLTSTMLKKRLSQALGHVPRGSDLTDVNKTTSIATEEQARAAKEIILHTRSWRIRKHPTRVCAWYNFRPGVENLGVLPWSHLQAMPMEKIKETETHSQRGVEMCCDCTAPGDPGAGCGVHPIPKCRSSQSKEKLRVCLLCCFAAVTCLH